MRLYFSSLLIATLTCSLGLFFGESSHAYLITYSACTALIWIPMLALSWDSLSNHPLPFISVGIASLFAVAIFIGEFRSPFHAYDYVNLIDASVAMACGVCCGLGAAYLPRPYKAVALTLMCCWLACACFAVGFTAHVWQRKWMTANEYVPTAILLISSLNISRVVNQK